MDLRNSFCNPSLQHIFGCDSYGRDFALLLLLGIKKSFFIAILAVLIKTLIAVPLGAIASLQERAGYFILKISDIFMAFPSLILALFFASILPASEYSIVFAICVSGWAPLTRYIKSSTDQIKNSLFLEAAYSTGASHSHVILKHVLPHFLKPLLIQVIYGISSAIFLETSLAFLGLGGPINEISWGHLFTEGRYYLMEHPRIFLIPLIFLTCILYALQVLAHKYTEK